MLWDDFLNSEYHDWRGSGKSEDRLDRPGWLAQWLRDNGLPDPGVPSAGEMEALKQLRAHMLHIVRQLVTQQSVGRSELDAVNLALAGGPSIRQLVLRDGRFQMDALPVRIDWSGIRAEIAASFAKMLAEGEPARLRICDNPDCLWVYYDETRNRSKRYCDDKICGNLMKVRRFRAKRKAAEAAASQGSAGPAADNDS